MLKINNLLIASVFTQTPRNKTWYKLQLEFIKETTLNYDHAVFIDRIGPELFDKSIVIGENKENISKVLVNGHNWSLAPHLLCLEQIVEYFKNNNKYEYCLILDSDCFPIRDKWQELILDRMKNKPIAAIVRTDNLDVFPHPSAFFMTRCALGKFSFRPIAEYQNLLGKNLVDVGCNINMDLCYPLLRTNSYNPNPVFCGIYFDAFYHHCCGSRKVDTRSSGYYSHLRLDDEEKLFNLLKYNPHKFIGKLRGINE